MASTITVPKTSPLAPKPKIPAGAAKAASPTAAAQSTINTIIAPIIKQISDAEAQRASQGQQLISGYTGDAAKQLAGIDYATPYATAAAQSDAINNALTARLQGQGTAGESQLQGALSAAGADPTLTAALKAQIGNIATGAANAGLATGDATTNQLLSEGANAQGYGNKLPGITELAGAQDVSKLLGQVANDQHTQLQSVQAQVPGMVQSELASEQTAKSQAATLAADRNKAMAAVIMANGYDPSTGGITPGAQKALAKLYGLPASSFTGTSASTAAKIIGENAANQRAAAGRAASAGRTAAANAKPNSALSREKGYFVDSNGNPIGGKVTPIAGYRIDPKTGNVVKDSTAAASKPLTVNEAKSAAGQANTIAEVAYKGGTDKKGNALKPLTYQQALDEMRNQGLLADPRTAKIAIGALNRWYGEGERGRPVSARSQKTLKVALGNMTPPLARFGG